MNFGAIAGFAVILILIISYFLNIQENIVLAFLPYGILIYVIIIGTKYLKKIENGKISYSRALGSGTLISLFASVIIALYMFIFFKFIDVDAIEKALLIKEQDMYSQGTPEEQIEMSMEIARKFATPFSSSIGSVFFYTGLGFLFSLITSAFIKKKSNSYDAAMAEIEKEINEENK